MKIKIICFTYLLTSSFLNSTGQKYNSDYYQYYLDIYNAEKKICENKFDSALFLYTKAFQENESKFYFDMHNAALCAEISKNHQTLDRIIRLLCSYGYNYDFINGTDFSLIDSLYNFKYLEILESLKTNFEKKIDTKLSEECVLRAELDQLADEERISCGSIESLKAFHDQVNENAFWLSQIIDSCGYPNRNLIGYAYKPNYSVVGIMIIHLFQQKTMKINKLLNRPNSFRYPEESIVSKYDSIPFLKIIANEVCNGNMNLEEYVKLHFYARTLLDGKYIYNYFYNSNTYPPIFNTEKDSLLIELSSELLNQINETYKTDTSRFKLGKSLYKLHSMYDNQRD
jgi:hypothetical protein